MTNTANTLPMIDTQTAMTVLEGYTDLCAAIRRDYPWARGADAAMRHERTLLDAERTLLPRLEPTLRVIAAGVITGARSEWKQVAARVANR